ncbi:MAG: ribosomal protein S18-alanine N-acetyltransferase [Mycoplasma sp.]
MLIKTNDIDSIYKLDKEIFGNESYSFDLFKCMLDTNHNFYFLNDNGVIVGYIIDLVAGDDLELIRIAVLKQYQKKGFAYQGLLKWITTSMFSNFFLEVKSDNEIAINLYSKIGFNKIHIRKKYYQDAKDAIIMKYTK